MVCNTGKTFIFPSCTIYSIVVTCSSGVEKVNIAVVTKLNLEARFVAYLLLLII